MGAFEDEFASLLCVVDRIPMIGKQLDEIVPFRGIAQMASHFLECIGIGRVVFEGFLEGFGGFFAIFDEIAVDVPNSGRESSAFFDVGFEINRMRFVVFDEFLEFVVGEELVSGSDEVESFIGEDIARRNG